MGSSDTDKPAKEPKTSPPASTQEQSSVMSTATVNAEWPGYQAYSHIPPPGYMASNPQTHPYMWGVQHMMPPYGTPPHPYVAMYPGGLYAHPTMPPGSYPFAQYAVPNPNGMAKASGNNNNQGSTDADSKQPEGKEKLPVKRMRGSLGSLNMITGKTNEEGKTTGTVANGASSKSAESGSDGSSDGSDADSQNDMPRKSEARQEATVSQNGNSTHVAQNGVVTVSHTMVNHAMAGPAAVGGPATNLNIGMDYWGAHATSPIPPMMGTPSASVATGMVPAGSRDNLQSQIWLQDERELKRQRRKQSNRESARRSRLRKQAECDELAQRAEVLREENANLRSELDRIRSDYDLLMTENTLLKEKLGKTPKDIGSKQAELSLANQTQESMKTTD